MSLNFWRMVTIPHGGLRTRIGQLLWRVNSNHHPTRWARNSHIPPPSGTYQTSMSPSHAVGLERFLESVEEDESIVASPSHTVGLELSVAEIVAMAIHIRSPSHTVGLEQKRKLCFYFCMLKNSHHPTRWARNVSTSPTSPAAAVGLHPTQWAKKLISVRSSRFLDSVSFPITIPHSGLGACSVGQGAGGIQPSSPSHAVGSELPYARLMFIGEDASPSHTVGLELVEE